MSPAARDLFHEANVHLDLARMTREVDPDHPDYIEEYALFEWYFAAFHRQALKDEQAKRLLDAIRQEEG